MVPTSSTVENDAAPPKGPHPSFIEVAKPFVFEKKLHECMIAIGMNEAKEDALRLQGVTWLENVRRSLQLPIRTFNTAVVYYHKFRLLHADTEYSYVDAAAAALFTACKIEDTLKKSREILCAHWNLKLPAAEHLSSDDPLFETHSKTIIGLERLMLEGASFDFRNRHPQRLVLKLAKHCHLPKRPVGRAAYHICCDLYRTFAPLKQTTATMAIACVELAARLYPNIAPVSSTFASPTSPNSFTTSPTSPTSPSDPDGDTMMAPPPTDPTTSDSTPPAGDNPALARATSLDYARFHTTRAEVMETLLDLLDLYTHHRPNTLVGPRHPLDAFINIRIALNHEAAAAELPRYTHWPEYPPNRSSASAAATTTTNNVAGGSGGAKANGIKAPTTRNGMSHPPSPTTPSAGGSVLSSAPGTAPSATTPPGATTAAGMGGRGQSGTVRFMLGAERARDEKSAVEAFFRVEVEEYEVEVVVEDGAGAAPGREREREKEKEKDGGREKERERDSGREKEREKDRDRDRERERERPKERERERDRDRERDARDVWREDKERDDTADRGAKRPRR